MYISMYLNVTFMFKSPSEALDHGGNSICHMILEGKI